MKSWRALSLIGLALILCIAFLGCGNSSKGTPTELNIPTGTSLPAGQVNTPYSATLSASGGTAPYTWGIISGTLPPGLSLGTAGAITGAPTAIGTSTFTVQVADAESTPQNATIQLRITIAPPTLIITTTSLPPGTINTAYSESVTATGGVPPYTWSITSGTLPPGLSLGTAGTIAGTPTAIGTSTFTVQVADAESTPQNATTQLRITIAPPTLIITTTSLPTGTINTVYSENVTPTGGVPPYTWSITSGTLPPGLSLNTAGTITGTPTAIGTSTFTVQAADAESTPQNATMQFSLTITHLSVTTQHNDNFRTGQNLSETVLNLSNVNVGQFGKLFSYAVDGDVHAQPLYVPQVPIGGKGVHNVVYVVTEHDSVYALDADSNTGGNSSPLWQTSFIDPAQGITTISDADVNCDAIAPEIGITSTPVIDTSANIIYVLAETKENGRFFHRLHALDITTGAEELGGPVTIEASVPGTGFGTSGGVITFDPAMHLQRPGLLLDNGYVVIAWASNCGNGTYHGWVMAYDKTSLQQKGVWATTANGANGGIWMSGAGIAADTSGGLFIPTANGTFDTSGEVIDLGDSIVRMTLSGSGFTIKDYFTPYDQNYLDQNDLDLGSGGVLLLPDQPGAHPHELVQAGKIGSIYVIDRDNMGHYNLSNNSQIIQNITNEIGHLYGAPAYWNNSVYFGGSFDNLKAFSVTNGLLSSLPISSSSAAFGYPGPSPSISANGNTNAIVWVLQTDTQNSGSEVLRAYDATNLANELYDSNQNLARDNPGGAVRFAVPTIANGRVYVGAQQLVSVYGINSQ